MPDVASQRETQLHIEQLVVGHNLDPNPIVSVLADALSEVFNSFDRVPAWLRTIQSIGEPTVAYVSICAILDQVSEDGGCAQAHSVLSEMAKRLKHHVPDLSRKIRVGLAFNILHACRDVDLIRMTLTKRGEPTTVISLTNHFKALLDEHDLWGLCGMTRRPMLCPPVPHTLDACGGYLTEALRVGISHGSWTNVRGTTIVDAMNKIQASPLAVNVTVLEAAEFLMQPHLDSKEANPYSHGRTLQVARELVGIPHWNPTYISKVGRIGLRGDVLSMQGNDLARGMIEFWDEWDVDEQGLFWIMVHVANTFSGTALAGDTKTDKLPFEQRVSWVLDNLDQILAIAEDPIAHRDLYWDGFGRGATTFQALLSAVSLWETMQTGKTSLPVRQDMTTNNYQWAAMFTRDRDLAELTNLLPDTRNDLHTEVANHNLMCWQDGTYDHDYVSIFVDNKDKLCTRKAAKPSSMVIGYGGGVRGIASQQLGKRTWTNLGTEDDPIWTRIASPDSVFHGTTITEELHGEASFYLAQDYEKSVKSIAPSAIAVTEFVRACVKVASERGEVMEWMSSTGLRVQNKPTTKQEHNLGAATCWSDRSCTQIKFWTFTDEIDDRKAKTGAPPIFTHTKDADHCAIVVTQCKSPVMQTIFDCFAAPAPFVDNMRETVKLGACVLMETHPLKDLSDRYGVPLPEMGTLTAGDIMGSEYALS